MLSKPSLFFSGLVHSVAVFKPYIAEAGDPIMLPGMSFFDLKCSSAIGGKLSFSKKCDV